MPLDAEFPANRVDIGPGDLEHLAPPPHSPNQARFLTERLLQEGGNLTIRSSPFGWRADPDLQLVTMDSLDPGRRGAGHNPNRYLNTVPGGDDGRP